MEKLGVMSVGRWRAIALYISTFVYEIFLLRNVEDFPTLVILPKEAVEAILGSNRPV